MEYDVSRREIPGLLARFFGIIGSTNILSAGAHIVNQLKQNPVLGEFLKEQRKIEIELCNIARYRRITGRIPRPSKSHDIYHALTFACAFVRIYDQLTKEAQAEFVGRVRGALKGHGNLSSIDHEILAATYLSRCGWAVYFNDLENKGRCDFVIAKNNTEIEVECKTISADAGRKIHRFDFRRFAGTLRKDLVNFLRNHDEIHLLRLLLNDRLPTHDQELGRIGHSILNLLGTNSRQIDAESYDLVYEIRSSQGSEDQITAYVADFVKKSIKYPNSHHSFFLGVKNGGMLFLAATSKRPDQVLTYLYKQLKDAHKQFSGTKPAILWVHIEDIEPEKWEELKQGSGLQVMSSRLLKSQRRQCICSVLFNSKGYLVSDGNVTMETGPTLYFDNTDSQFYSSRIDDVVGTTSRK